MARDLVDIVNELHQLSTKEFEHWGVYSLRELSLTLHMLAHELAEIAGIGKETSVNLAHE